ADELQSFLQVADLVAFAAALPATAFFAQLSIDHATLRPSGCAIVEERDAGGDRGPAPICMLLMLHAESQAARLFLGGHDGGAARQRAQRLPRGFDDRCGSVVASLHGCTLAPFVVIHFRLHPSCTTPLGYLAARQPIIFYTRDIHV